MFISDRVQYNYSCLGLDLDMNDEYLESAGVGLLVIYTKIVCRLNKLNPKAHSSEPTVYEWSTRYTCGSLFDVYIITTGACFGTLPQ